MRRKVFNSESPLETWKETPLPKPSHPSLPNHSRSSSHHAHHSDYLHRPLHTTTNLLPNSRVLPRRQLSQDQLPSVSPSDRSSHTRNGTTPSPSDFHVTLRAQSLVSAEAAFVSLCSVYTYHRPTRIRVTKTGECGSHTHVHSAREPHPCPKSQGPSG